MSKIRFGLVLGVSAILLVGCSSSTPKDAGTQSPSASPSTSIAEVDPTAVSQDDAFWLNMMNAHHQQAIDMSDFATSKSKNSEIKALATAIRAAQGPEMEYMNGLLQAGGFTEPLDITEHLAHMQGMLTADQLTQLEAKTGNDFDIAFLESMIAHHEGAVSMSENIMLATANTAIKELAAKIIEAQNAEIVSMRILLGQLQ